MENFVIKYLTANYYIKKSSIGNYVIYPTPSDEHTIFFNGNKLVKEISYVFGITTRNARKYINKWVGDKDLTTYWRLSSMVVDSNINFTNNISNTISAGIINPSPLSPPTGHLYWFDYVYSGNT